MFKKLKSLFVIEDEQSASQANQNDQETTGTADADSSGMPAPTIKIEKPVFSKDNPPKGAPNEKFINILLGAIEKNNVKGFDYLEFKQALQNLGNVDMDEETRFKSGLAMAKTMGATKEILLQSANLYLKVLGEEEAKFMDSFSQQLKLLVDQRTEEITNLEKGIALKKKQIDELTKEIEAQTTALEANKSGAELASSKVEGTKNDFYHSYHIVTQQIKDDISKMQKYLA